MSSSEEKTLESTSSVSPDSTVQDRSLPVGLGGWLLIFVLQVWITAASRLATGASTLAARFHLISAPIAPEPAGVFNALTAIVAGLYGVITGFTLLRKSRSGPFLARILLTLDLGYYLIYLKVALLAGHVTFSGGIPVWAKPGTYVLSAIVWFAYLVRSRRVANTYYRTAQRVLAVDMGLNEKDSDYLRNRIFPFQEVRPDDSPESPAIDGLAEEELLEPHETRLGDSYGDGSTLEEPAEGTGSHDLNWLELSSQELRAADVTLPGTRVRQPERQDLGWQGLNTRELRTTDARASGSNTQHPDRQDLSWLGLNAQELRTVDASAPSSRSLQSEDQDVSWHRLELDKRENTELYDHDIAWHEQNGHEPHTEEPGSRIWSANDSAWHEIDEPLQQGQESSPQQSQEFSWEKPGKQEIETPLAQTESKPVFSGWRELNTSARPWQDSETEPSIPFVGKEKKPESAESYFAWRAQRAAAQPVADSAPRQQPTEEPTWDDLCEKSSPRDRTDAAPTQIMQEAASPLSETRAEPAGEPIRQQLSVEAPLAALHSAPDQFGPNAYNTGTQTQETQGPVWHTPEPEPSFSAEPASQPVAKPEPIPQPLPVQNRFTPEPPEELHIQDLFARKPIPRNVPLQSFRTPAPLDPAPQAQTHQALNSHDDPAQTAVTQERQPQESPVAEPRLIDLHRSDPRELDELKMRLANGITQWLDARASNGAGRPNAALAAFAQMGVSGVDRIQQKLLDQVNAICEQAWSEYTGPGPHSQDSPRSLAVELQKQVAAQAIRCLTRSLDVRAAMQACGDFERVAEDSDYLLAVARRNPPEGWVGDNFESGESAQPAPEIACLLIVNAQRDMFEADMWAHVASLAGDPDFLNGFPNIGTRVFRDSIDYWRAQRAGVPEVRPSLTGVR